MPFVESFIGRLRDECLNETLFGSLAQARAVLILAWGLQRCAPHSALANRTPQNSEPSTLPLRSVAGTVKSLTQGSTPDWKK
jgi:putative transposase